MGAKKKNASYRAAVTGARGILKILIYICLLLVLLFAGKTAYEFGYDIFNQQPAATARDGVDVTVQVTESMDEKDVGELLIENGLINESLYVFRAQVIFSGYHGKLLPGTYILNTSQTVDDMLEILSGKNTEGQPKPEDAAGQE